MGDGARGTVTALGSLFPAEESQKAAQRVEDAIAERRGELRRLQGFVADNSALIKLVHSLPDELSHDIMVPFGGAAFFPGRLIHTNEFLVLLGEGYYAERSAKQTVDILQRRQKVLESKAESLKATMADLEAQAKFFSNTAAEAVEGLVEIREEYIEEPEKSTSSSASLAGSNSLDTAKTDNLQKPSENEDEEFARIMARIEELEKEEEELENRSTSVKGNEDSEDIVSPHEDDHEGEDSESGDEDEDSEAGYNFLKSDNKHDVLEIKHKSNDPVQKSRGSAMFSSIDSTGIGCISEQHLTDQSFTDSKMKFPDEAPSFSNNNQSISNKQSAASPSDAKFSFSNIEDSSKDAASQSSNAVSSGRKAFTGSIVEHDNLPPIKSSKSTNMAQSSDSGSSKPVSRFKMQRGNR